MANAHAMIALFLSMLLVAPVAAQERPTTGQISNKTEFSSLYFECGISDPLVCEFSQVTVSKPELLTDEEIENRVREGMLELPLPVDTCSQARAVRDRLALGVDEDRPLSDDERATALEATQSLLNICADPSEESLRTFLRAENDRKRETCKVWTLPFEMTFDWNYSTERWESLSAPTGACGLVTAAHMTKDGYFWVYGQQRIITNRGGTDPLFGPCSEYPAEEMSYQWQARTVLAQCKYVEFSLF